MSTCDRDWVKIPYWDAPATGAHIYNLDLYENAGIGELDWNWTWDDFIQYGARLTKDTNGDGVPEVWGTGFNRSQRDPFLHVIHSFGGRWFTNDLDRAAINSHESVQALEFLRDLSDGYGILGSTSSAEFWSGNNASMWTWTHHSAAYVLRAQEQHGFTARVHPLPMGPGGRQLTRPRGYPFDALVIAKDTPHPDAAWSLVRFMTTEPEAIAASLQAGTDPITLVPYREQLSAFLDYLPEQLSGEWFSTMQRMVDDMIAEDDAEIFPEKVWSEFDQSGQRETLLGRFFAGQASAREVLASWETQLNSIIEAQRQ